MKLKQLPEDFQVEELTELAPSEQGPFALYRLEKRGWTTPDALAVVQRRWRIEGRRVAFSGLKDRHAQTVQCFTILRGPRRNLHQQEITVRYLGQVAEPCESRHIRGNRFQITLRHLANQTVPHCLQALDEVRRDGLPNYFDDQRFGSVSGHGTFVARFLVLGQFEEALRTALTAPYEFDRVAQKREKALLRSHWGDWATCQQRVKCGPVDYLVQHPDDFRGAVARLRPDQRLLYLSAYQSHLWNRLLARWLEQQCRPEQLVSVPLRLGAVPFPRGLGDATRAAFTTLSLPLPTARLHLDSSDPRLPLLESVLAEEGLELRQLQVRGVRELFFSKGERAAHVQPAQLAWETGEDELNRDRHKLILSFALPRGAYATVLVKRITLRD